MDPITLLPDSSEMAKRRESPADKFKTLSEQVGSLPKLLKILLVMTIMGLGLSCTSICLQVYNAKILRRVEERHDSCIKRIKSSKVSGGTSGLRIIKRSLIEQVVGEADESNQKQCRYRQKTDWMYYDSESVETAGNITVDFHAAQGHVISTASCTASVGSLKLLKHSERGGNKIYHCTCTANSPQSKDNQVGFKKLTCTANYWECPIK